MWARKSKNSKNHQKSPETGLKTKLTGNSFWRSKRTAFICKILWGFNWMLTWAFGLNVSFKSFQVESPLKSRLKSIEASRNSREFQVCYWRLLIIIKAIITTVNKDVNNDVNHLRATLTNHTSPPDSILTHSRRSVGIILEESDYHL